MTSLTGAESMPLRETHRRSVPGLAPGTPTGRYGRILARVRTRLRPTAVALLRLGGRERSWALQNGAYRRGPPLCAAVRRWRSGGVEAPRDLGEALAVGTLGLDSIDDRGRQGCGPPGCRRTGRLGSRASPFCEEAFELVDGHELCARRHLDR